MHKIKYYPDVALLLMRLVTGIGFLFLLYPLAEYITKNGMTSDIKWIDIVDASVLFVCSIFLILGLYSRWTSAVMVVTLLVAGFMGLPSLGELFSNLTIINFFRLILGQLTNILIPLSIWLLGTGKYSLDHKIWKQS